MAMILGWLFLATYYSVLVSFSPHGVFKAEQEDELIDSFKGMSRWTILPNELWNSAIIAAVDLAYFFASLGSVVTV